MLLHILYILPAYKGSLHPKEEPNSYSISQFYANKIIHFTQKLLNCSLPVIGKGMQSFLRFKNQRNKFHFIPVVIRQIKFLESC